MYETDEWSLGLGDLVFYSMLCSAAVMYMGTPLPYYQFYTPALGALFPWLYMGIISLAILFGFVLSIKMLSSRSLLPGLPMSIFIGLGLFTSNVIAQGSVTATVSTTSSPPPAGGNQLVSGQSRTFNIAPASSPRRRWPAWCGP